MLPSVETGDAWTTDEAPHLRLARRGTHGWR